MTWGLVARADNGGLGTLSWEIARHLHPDRILVVDPGAARGRPSSRTRGGSDPDRLADYTDALGVVTLGPDLDLPPAVTQSWLAGLDSVLCLETAYDRRFWDWAREAGVRSYLYAMPELLDPADLDRWAGPDRIWIPEAYGGSGMAPPDLGRISVLPWPTSPDANNRWPLERAVDPPPLLLHQTGRAMLDRNGTRALLAACERMTQTCDLEILGADHNDRLRIGPVRVTQRAWHPDDWRDLYDYGDLLVLPRRYGWLSLPMLEAAAAGMATVTTDLHPQNGWFSWAPELLVPASNPSPARMKGGLVNVWDPHVSTLAARLDRLVSQPDVIADLGLRAHAWASTRSWETLGPLWTEALS